MNANRMCSTLTTLAAAAVFCCAPAFAGAQDQTPPARGNAGNSTMSGMQSKMSAMGNSAMASPQDRMFLKKAAAGNMAEIKTAQLALQKSNNDQVKQFAQKMIDDHTKLADQAKPVAEQANVTLPTQPMPKEQAMYSKLEGMSGADFDKAYMKGMVKDHEEDLKDFKKEASMGQDQQVKDLASQGEPVIQSHLDMAKQVATSVGAMGGSKMSSGNGSM